MSKRKTIEQKNKRELIKTSDKIFSEYIRLNDADDNGFCQCITCGSIKHWKNIHNLLNEGSNPFSAKKWLERKNWHGWTPQSGVTRLEYFINEKVSSKCTGICKECGFYFLNKDGLLLLNTDDTFPENSMPLCGIN